MNDALKKLNLPDNVATGLVRLCTDLQAAAGKNLAGLILYGGLARGRYVPGRSDINLVILLHDAGVNALAALASRLHAAWREWRVEPFLLVPAEIAATAAAFPTKFLDIKNHHVLLVGADPFSTLQVPREFVRLRIEQELRNMGLRLRRRFVSIESDVGELHFTLRDAARPLALELASLLAYSGKPVPPQDRTAAIMDAAASAFGLDRDTLAELASLREPGVLFDEVRELYDRTLAVVARAAELVAQMKEATP